VVWLQTRTPPELWQVQREVRAGSRESLTREGWEDFREEKHLSG